MTRNRPGRPMLVTAAACAIGICACPVQAESWSSLAFIPNTQAYVSFDRTSIVKDHGLTRAWYLFTYTTPITTSESYVLRSYKQHEVIDCKRQGSFTDSFIAYSDADGKGRLIYTWSGPTAVLPPLNPSIPGTVRALMIDAACAPPPSPPAFMPPVPPAPAPASASATVAEPGPNAAPAIGYPETRGQTTIN